MGIKLKTADISVVKHEASARHPAKPHYKNSHLPFKDPTHDLDTWRDAVLPSIIDWAGSLNEPFAINSHPNLQEIIEENWKANYPEVQCNDAVLAVVSQKSHFFTINIQVSHINISPRQVQPSTTGEIPLGNMLSRSSPKSLQQSHSRTRRHNARNMSRTN